MSTCFIFPASLYSSLLLLLISSHLISSPSAELDSSSSGHAPGEADGAAAADVPGGTDGAAAAAVVVVGGDARDEQEDDEDEEDVVAVLHATSSLAVCVGVCVCVQDSCYETVAVLWVNSPHEAVNRGPCSVKWVFLFLLLVKQEFKKKIVPGLQVN